MSTHPCPSCGAEQPAGRTCQDDFFQLLYWENEDPALGAVHHLTVLCYYLQHPHLYSPEGLTYALGLLAGFLSGVTPAAARVAARPRVDSGARAWKVTARPGAEGVYPHPVRWSVTAAGVVAVGKYAYLSAVPAWARAIDVDLRASGNLPGSSR